MRNKLIGAAILLLSLSPGMLAQFNTYSPYTRFGLGDLAKPGLGQNLSMGGTGIAIHNNSRINYLNPAAFASIDSTSVFFDFGVNSFHNQYETANAKNTWWNMNLHHVTFASSMGKHLGFSAGIVPYSSVGYNIKQEYNDTQTGTALDIYNKGDGGILNFYVGTAMKFFDRISIGVTMNYLLGRLTREQLAKLPAYKTWSAKSVQNLDLRQPVFSFGLQYQETFDDRFFFCLGGTYDLETRIRANTKTRITNNVYPYKRAHLNDSVIIDPAYKLDEDTLMAPFTLPSKTGLGLAFGIPGKLTITADYYMQDWTGSLSGYNYSTTKASSIHFGAELIPNQKALRGYHKFIAYRLGGYYSDYYLVVNGEQLKDYGITFGLGLPVKSMKTSLNVSFTLGTRGTTDFNLVKENYGIITFNVTLHDLWFRKRKFD